MSNKGSEQQSEAIAAKSATSGKVVGRDKSTRTHDLQTLTKGETMYEHALKNTQSRRLREVLGKR